MNPIILELAWPLVRTGLRALMRRVGRKKFRKATEIAALLIDEANRVLAESPGADKKAWVLERMAAEPVFEKIDGNNRVRLIKLVESVFPQGDESVEDLEQEEDLPVVQIAVEHLESVGLPTLARELREAV